MRWTLYKFKLKPEAFQNEIDRQPHMAAWELVHGSVLWRQAAVAVKLRQIKTTKYYSMQQQSPET